MSTTTNPESGILTRLAEAIETRDADGVLTWYQPDARLTLFDRDHPPAAPQVLDGIDAIAAYYRDVCGRAMEHRVRDAVATSHGLAYTEHCRYPDGTEVVCVAVARLTGGKIQHQTGVQVWDS